MVTYVREDIICSDCGEPAKEHGYGGRFVPRYPDSSFQYPMEMIQTCANTEAGLLRDALRQFREKENADLKALARVVLALVPLKEKVRHTDNLDDPEYLFHWEDLVTISDLSHFSRVPHE